MTLLGIGNVPSLHAPSEDLSIVRQNNGFRPAGQPAPPLYDDDVKSVISEGSEDEAGPGDAPVPNKIVAPVPTFLNDNDTVESWLEDTAVPDKETPSPSSKNHRKRAREDDEDDTNLDKYRQLIKDRQELDRLKIDNEDKLERIGAKLAIIAKRQEEKEAELDTMLARTPAKEMKKWLKRTVSWISSD
jgi:hypothetical protein